MQVQRTWGGNSTIPAVISQRNTKQVKLFFSSTELFWLYLRIKSESAPRISFLLSQTILKSVSDICNTYYLSTVYIILYLYILYLSDVQWVVFFCLDKLPLFSKHQSMIIIVQSHLHSLLIIIDTCFCCTLNFEFNMIGGLSLKYDSIFMCRVRLFTVIFTWLQYGTSSSF